MTGREFDRTAIAVAQQSFTERLGRGQPLPAQPTAAPAPVGTYRAFGAMAAEGITETCDIQGWMENTSIATGIELQYRFLMQVGYVGEEQLKLFLPDCIVVIDGQHLLKLRKALARRQCNFIQQYSSRIWPQAPEKGETLVERITITRPSEEAQPRGKNSL